MNIDYSQKANEYTYDDDPQVSVIIPVYNTEKFLAECLDSVLAQTMQDFEVICVDDGSTDDSPEILEEYAAKDGRITVLRQQNSFAGTARNSGIDYARGKYLYFLDSDDFISPKLLEKAVSRAEETEADIVVFGADDFNTVTGETTPHPAYLNNDVIKDLDVFSVRDIPREIFTFTNPAPWNKLYRRQFVLGQELRFQSLPYSNDVYFTKLAFALADRISAIDDRLVCYRIGMTQNSQSRKFRDPFRYLEALEALYKELKDRGIFDIVEESFDEYVINCFYYELKPYAVRSDRIKAYRKVLTSGLCEHALADKREEHLEPAKLHYLKGLKSALELREDLGRTEWPEVELVCESDDIPDRPVVSVIIPVYNNARYITDCLESIDNAACDPDGNESHKVPYEIVVTNDGSTDGTLDRLVSYAGSHENIRVFTQKNSGPSAARNNAIRNARGDILVMVDSDDLLAPGALCLIADRFGDNDLLFYNVKPFADDQNNDSQEFIAERLERFTAYYRRTGEYSSESSRGAELFDRFVNNGDYLPSPVFQAIKRRYFLENELWFKEGILHEDHIYLFKALLCSDCVAMLTGTDELYLRRVRINSIMTGRVSWRNVYGYYLSYRKMSDFYYNGRNENGWTNYHSEIYKVLRGVLGAARRDYLELPADEKHFWHGLYDADKDMFEDLVVDYISIERAYNRNNRKKESVESKLENARAELRQIRKELKKFRRSGSTRLKDRIKHLFGK